MADLRMEWAVVLVVVWSSWQQLVVDMMLGEVWLMVGPQVV